MQHLLELPYLPPVSWMTLAWHSEVLWVEAFENFQKGGYRNRCHIAGPNGMQRLSIPLLKGKNQQTLIREVRISNRDAWQTVHWRSICTAYGNAPYFEYFSEELHPFFLKRYDFLFDFNLEIMHYLLKKIGWPGTLRLTEKYDRSPELSPVLDARNAVSPKANTTPDWFSPKSYPQVFMERHGFLPDLSALDLLLCCGKQSGNVLQESFSGKVK